MPPVEVVLFADDDGSAPVLDWLDDLPTKVRDKFMIRVERLEECGSELRRPEADSLRDGILELRVRNMRINYRILYFFHGRRAVLSHGLTKIDKVPDTDIKRAINHREAFAQRPDKHTYGE